jgi:hypothetical protein
MRQFAFLPQIVAATCPIASRTCARLKISWAYCFALSLEYLAYSAAERLLSVCGYPSTKRRSLSSRFFGHSSDVLAGMAVSFGVTRTREPDGLDSGTGAGVAEIQAPFSAAWKSV